MLKGITVTLYEKKPAGVDSFNRQLYETVPVNVENVLVGHGESDQVVDQINLVGKNTSWMLGIPKGDTHNWLDADVEFILAEKHKCHTVGSYIEGIEDMIPLAWHKQIKCEKYE